jgi:hypothetical protein
MFTGVHQSVTCRDTSYADASEWPRTVANETQTETRSRAFPAVLTGAFLGANVSVEAIS